MSLYKKTATMEIGMEEVKAITRKQRNVLVLIDEHQTDKNYPPTIKYLADELGVACNAAQLHVTALNHKGYITKVKGQARSITVTEKGLMELANA